MMSNLLRSDHNAVTWSRVAKFCAHVLALFLGFLLAYELRRALPLEWWFFHPDALRVIKWAALFAAIGAAVELVFQTERSVWRFSSVREAVALATSVSVTMLVFLGVVFFADRGILLPRSVLPLAWVMSLVLLVGLRLGWRLRHQRGLHTALLSNWWRGRKAGRMPMLVLGPMDLVDGQLRLILEAPQSPYQPIAVVTPVREEVGLRLHGVPFVGSLSNWPDIQQSLLAEDATRHAILFTEIQFREPFTADVIGALRRAGHTLLRPQSMVDIDGVKADGLKEIPLEDFLPRSVISLDDKPLRELVAGQRMLVTGAGGSIGSEICRQLVNLGCRHLSMVDHSEFLLFEIDRELGPDTAQTSRRPILANVRDEGWLQATIQSERPDIIFHAAALKHVALVEKNPREGVLTNVLGTWNVLGAAVSHDVKQFVLISTDKAVDPTSVMGATKRIAEALMVLLPKGRTRLTTVRFGNVLGSAGSVVPIFKEQIARGGPVTVTHAEVNRYFMTIPEAVQLVLHSTAINAGQDTDIPRKFLLEMGQPVKIVDLARRLIELSGKQPDIDIKIELTGLTAGEKVSEVLYDDGEDVHPCVDGILEIRHSTRPPGCSMAEIQGLVTMAEDLGDDDLVAEIFRLVSKIRHA